LGLPALAPDIKVEIVEIGHQMNQAGLPKEFIAAAVSTAFEFEGVYDLLKMWGSESEAVERDEIVSDIQELIDDCGQQGKIEGIYVRFDDLEGIAKNIRTFKDNLRALVDQKGGVKHLAEETGIPQPSLSRFFNSATMPRRATLHKIARALKLSQVEIATEWSR
jgi:DNA-binding phage protein